MPNSSIAVENAYLETANLKTKGLRSYTRVMELLLLCYIFAGVMGKLIPIFFIPAIKSLRPHYGVACIMAGSLLAYFTFYKPGLGSIKSYCLPSILAWGGFVGVGAISFLNLKPMQVLLYQRPEGVDPLFIKWTLMIVLIVLCLYFYQVAKTRKGLVQKIVKALDRAFVTYFLVGWPFYILAITKKISLETYALFTVPGENVESIYRFCPGDYPNGAGELMAFYIVFLIFMRRHVKYVPLKMMVGMPALLLTTTRGGIIPAFAVLFAFLAYRFMVHLSLFSYNKISRKVVFMMVLLVLGSGILIGVGSQIDIVVQKIEILYKGLGHITDSASSEERLVNWGIAFKILHDTCGLGDGFGRHIETHNVVIQELAEIGIIGTSFFVFYVIVRIMAIADAYFRKSWGRAGVEPDFIRMLLVAVPVNAFFSLTNHNLFHFVFWFISIASFIVESLPAGGNHGDEALAAIAGNDRSARLP
jgi:hypothetical protein